MSGSFPRSARLLTAADFNGVFRGNNKRFGNHFWTALAVRRKPADPQDSQDEQCEPDSGARLGLAIAKKRARRAVDRNRLKRQVRESFRLHRESLGSMDVVVMNRDSAASAGKPELRRKLDELWFQIAEHASESAE